MTIDPTILTFVGGALIAAIPSIFAAGVVVSTVRRLVCEVRELRKVVNDHVKHDEEVQEEIKKEVGNVREDVSVLKDRSMRYQNSRWGQIQP